MGNNQPRTKRTIKALRLALDATAIRSSEADRDGAQIEFINEEILNLTAELGRRLGKRP